MRPIMQLGKGFRIDCVLLAALTFWGFILRFYEIEAPSFWIDEAVSVCQAQAILEHGIPKLQNNVIDWSSYPVSYLIAAGIRLCEDQHFGARIFSAIFGAMAIPLAFLVSRHLFNEKDSGILASLCVALMHDQIAWSRQARPYILLQFFFLLTVYFVLRFINRRRTFYALLAVACGILSVGCHRAGYLALMVVVLIGLFLLCNAQFLSRKGTADFVRSCTILLALAAVSICACLLPASRSNLREAIASLRNPYSTNYSIQYLSVLRQEFGTVSLALFLVGIIAGIRRNWRVASALAISLAVYYLVLSYHTWMFANRYIFPIYIIVCLFVSYGLFCLVKLVFSASRLQQSSKTFTMVFTASCVLCLQSFNIVAWPSRNYWLGHTAPQPDWRETYDLIKEHHDLRSEKSQELVTMSAYPLLHDVYLGPNVGKKYYVPINFCGHPDGVQWTPPHTTADVVDSLEEMLSLSGYLILDDFSLRMIGNKKIRSYVETHRPNAIVAGKYNVFVWKL